MLLCVCREVSIMAKNILECHNIVKEYDKHRVVDGANIHVKEGEIYGIVGPNGAGKSTIMKMILKKSTF